MTFRSAVLLSRPRGLADDASQSTPPSDTLPVLLRSVRIPRHARGAVRRGIVPLDA